MQFNYRWLFSAGAIIGIAICLILTTITSDREQTDQLHGRIKKDDPNFKDLLRDHWDLAKLFNIIHLNCEFLSGKVESDDVINQLWNFTNQTSIHKLVTADLKQLSRSLEEISDAIDQTPFENIDPIDFDLILKGFIAIEQTRELQNSSKALKQQGKVALINEIKKLQGFNWTKINEESTKFSDFFNQLGNKDQTSADLKNFSEIHMVVTETSFKALKLSYDTMRSYNQAFQHIENVLNEYFEHPKFNETFVKRASKQLKSAANQFETLQPLISEMIKFHKLRNQIEWLKTLVHNIISSRPNYKMLIDSEEIFDLKKNIFLSNIFNNNNGLEAMITGITPIKKYVEDSIRLGKYLNSMKDQSKILNSLSDSFIPLEGVHKNSDQLKKTMQLYKCFDNVRIQEYSKLDELSKSYGVWLKFVRTLNSHYGGFFTKRLNLSDINSYVELQNETLKIYNTTSGSTLKSVKELVKKHIYQHVKKTIYEMVSHSAAFLTHRFDGIDQSQIKTAWTALNDYQNWVNTTDFGWIDDSCLQENLKTDPFLLFLQLHESIEVLRKRNEIPKLLINAVHPLRLAQVRIKNLTAIADRMKEFPSSYHIFCNELCQRMNDVQDLLLSFPQGVMYLERLFGALKQRENVRDLLKQADYVIGKSKEVPERSHQAYMIEDYFEEMKLKKLDITKTFEAIQDLAKKHQNGKWINLASLSTIYVAARNIKSPIDWKKLNELMDRFPETSYKNDTALQTVRRITNGLASMMDNLDLAYVAFEKSANALNSLDPHFDEFFEWSRAKPSSYWNIILGYLIVIGSSSLLLIGSIVFLAFMIRDPKQTQRRITPEDRKDWPEFVPSEEPVHLWPLMLQECRLPINQRDKNGYTKLYLAVCNGNYEAAKSLVEQGAAIDAACGPQARTALHEAVEYADYKMVELLLKNGADRKCLDAKDQKPKDLFSPNNFIPGLFAKYYDMNRKRIMPKVKRDFYVLIVDRSQFAEEFLEMLPENMEVVYGYKEGDTDLDEFTHFVMSPSAVGSRDLHLDLNNMLAFEAITKPGMIVSTEWLDACLDDPNEMDSDWRYVLTNIIFEKKTHENVLLRLKTDIHRLRPPLLFGTEVTILPTRNRIMQTDREIWIRIITSLGGKYVTTPYPSEPNDELYHAPRRLKLIEVEVKEPPVKVKKPSEEVKDPSLEARNSSTEVKVPSVEVKDPPIEEKGPPQMRKIKMLVKNVIIHPTIVLYFDDSVLQERWTYPENNISMLGMGWLPESIVRYSLLHRQHRCLRNEKDVDLLPRICEQGVDRTKQ